MKTFKNMAFITLTVCIGAILGMYFYYSSELKPVSNSEEIVLVEIESGMTSSQIGELLEEKGLIKSAKIFLLYLKLEDNPILQAGFYSLTPSMGVETVVSEIESGNAINPGAFNITVKEGINIRALAKKIAEETNNTEADVYSKLNDKEYLSSLIEKYWFITDDILNADIYYSLEGYLSPNTYTLANKDVTVEQIFKKMLDQQGVVLNKYKTQIENSDYTVHEILTLASVVELEGVDAESRKIIAGIFYNRLEVNQPLGSDVTTYYGAKVDMADRDLYESEIKEESAYNTRSYNLAGKLPVGPICLVSEESIDAVLNPTQTNYMYFIADKNKKVYYSETYAEHLKTKQEIIDSGNWIEW